MRLSAYAVVALIVAAVGTFRSIACEIYTRADAEATVAYLKRSVARSPPRRAAITRYGRTSGS